MPEINHSLNGGCHGDCKEKNNCQKESHYQENRDKEKNEKVNLRPFGNQKGGNEVI